MPREILKLTEQQVSRFPEWVEKWVAIGLSTEPADWESAVRGVLGCYAAASLPRPPIVLRVSSPFGAIYGGALAVLATHGKAKSQVGSQVELQVESQVGSQVWSQVGSQVGSQVRSQVGSQVWSQVWSQVGSQVRSQVESQVGSQVRSQVESQVGSQVGSQVELQVWSQVGSLVGSLVWSQYRGGQLWASWYAYMTYLRDVCGWEGPLLTAFACDELHALSASWAWYHDRVVAISDRPAALHRDAEGRLHGEDGPALLYRDGWAIHAVHGVVVPAHVVERAESITIAEIDKEKNEEVRRVMIERMGWVRYLKKSGAKMLDGRLNEIDRQRECLVSDKHNNRRLVVADPSTGRVYALGVPSDVASCEAAQKWLNHGFPIVHRS